MPAEHLNTFATRLAPRSNFDRALLALLALAPRHGRDGLRDGRRAAMLAALDNRATWQQVRAWRRARRGVPQWAIDLLDSKLAKRQAELDNARLKRCV